MVSGVIITVIFFYLSAFPMSTMTGVMSGAVTNTPGLGAAQAAVKDLHIGGSDTSLMTLAYAVAYPFGVFGIIIAMLLLKKLFGINLDREKELHRKLDVLRSNRPVSLHLILENKQLDGKPLRVLFDLLKEPIVVSRLSHDGVIFTPSPSTVLAEGDILLVVASRKKWSN
ncbi:MAG: hypothetical protein IPP79_07990 [Chitinophagaceae bacterium]|nr:hypothetical protein [Chitinophagaceae bacterium]